MIEIFFPILLSFLVAFIFINIWTRKAKSIGMIWDDMNKYNRPKVAGSGGVICLLAFLTGVFSFVAYITFYQGRTSHLIEILALLLVVVFASGIGFIDDLMGWRSGGLSRRSRLLLLAVAAIPLMAINAGKDTMSLPLLGNISLGLLYPLFIIPMGIMGATATFNFLAGYNGLEAGQGILILSAMAFVSFKTGNSWLSIIALCMVGALLAFIIYNYYPAKVFPGDSLTYALGSLIAIMSILGNFEKIAVFFFIPYIIETILKSKGKLVKYSFGKPLKDGELTMPYDKIYGLEHASIKLIKLFKIKPTEQRVVWSLWIFQLVIILIGLIVFRKGIFGVG